MHGPRKENGNIYLLYENGDDCGNGKNYSSRIQMECGDTEVSKGSDFEFFVFVPCFRFNNAFEKHKQVKTNHIMSQRFGDLVTPLSRNE